MVTGELTYKRANVTLDYAEKHIDLAKDDEQNCVLETGDMAWCDTTQQYKAVGGVFHYGRVFA